MTEGSAGSSDSAPAVDEAGLRRTAVSGGVWVAGALIVQAVVKLGTFVALARVVAPPAFGLYATAVLFLGLASHFAHFGIGMAVVQRPSVTLPELRAAHTLTLLTGLAATGAVLLTAPLLGALMHMPRLPLVLSLLAPSLVLLGLGVCSEASLQRGLEFRRLAAIDICAVAGAYSLTAVVLGLLGGGLWALVGAHLAEAIVRTALLMYSSPIAGGLTTRVWPAGRSLVHFGAGATIGRVFNEIALRADYLVVGRWLGVGALGLYERSYQLVSGLGALPGQAASDVLFPTLSSQTADPSRSLKYLGATIRLLGIGLIPASAVVIVVAEPLVAVIFGEQWLAMAEPLRILMAVVIARSGYKVADAVIRAHGMIYRRAGVQAIYAAAVVTGALAGTPWGVTGVAWGVVLAITLHYGLMCRLALQCTAGRWLNLVRWHLPGLCVGLAGAAGAAAGLRLAAGMDEIVRLAAGMGLGAAAVLVLLLAARRVLLGAEQVVIRELVSLAASRLTSLKSRMRAR